MDQTIAQAQEARKMADAAAAAIAAAERAKAAALREGKSAIVSRAQAIIDTNSKRLADANERLRHTLDEIRRCEEERRLIPLLSAQLREPMAIPAYAPEGLREDLNRQRSILLGERQDFHDAVKNHNQKCRTGDSRDARFVADCRRAFDILQARYEELSTRIEGFDREVKAAPLVRRFLDANKGLADSLTAWRNELTAVALTNTSEYITSGNLIRQLVSFLAVAAKDPRAALLVPATEILLKVKSFLEQYPCGFNEGTRVSCQNAKRFYELAESAQAELTRARVFVER